MSKEDKKIYKVRQSQRTNPLSREPSNNTITVHYDGYDTEYNNVHYPTAFANTIMKTNKEDWISISLNGKHWGSNPNNKSKQS